MARVGFVRQIDRYVHSESRFFVEFPRGPLSIGRDVQIEPVMVRIGSAKFLALSATDSCRDRLAAFYHWNDRQSLETAVLIALRSRMNTKKLRTWSADENALGGFGEFVRELKSRRPSAKRRRKPSSR